MNALAHRALVADHERSRRARVRRARLGELRGLEVEEAGDPEGLVRTQASVRLERRGSRG